MHCDLRLQSAASRFSNHQALAAVLANPQENAPEGSSTRGTVERVIEALVTPGRIRPRGWCITERNRDSLRQIVERAIKLGAPLPAVCPAAGIKGYHPFTSDRPADVAELFWMNRFRFLDERVRQVYSPGIRVKLVLEDLGEEVLAGLDPEVLPRIERYTASLTGLASAIAPESVELVRESKLFGERKVSQAAATRFSLVTGEPVTRDIFLSVADGLKGFFVAYLEESDPVAPRDENDPDTRYRQLPSFEALQALGWQGAIPANQRGYYRCRAETGFCSSGASPAAVTSMVATYLGAGFARGQLGLHQPWLADGDGPIPPIKMSFALYPPGTPKALEVGRIEYLAFYRAKGSSERTAPWIGTGALCSNGATLSQCILGTNRCQEYATIERCVVTVRGGTHDVDVECPIVGRSS